MPDIAQVAFTKGEISPIAASRTDQSFYESAVALAQNFFVRREGGISNRPGLQFIGNCLTNIQYGSVLIPFVYNNQQSYLIEAGPGLMQFFSQGAFVQVPGGPVAITGVTTAPGAPGVLIVTVTAANNFVVGQQATISGMLYTGTTNPNQSWGVTSASSTQFTFNMFVGIHGNFHWVGFGTVTGNSNVATPYGATDCFNLRWAQSADTLNLAVSTQQPYQVRRITVNQFSFTPNNFVNGPFQNINTDGTTYMYVSGAGNGAGTVDIFCSAPIFTAQHIGALITIQEQYLDGIPPWVAEQFLEQGGGNPIGLYCRSDGKIYQCVAVNTVSSTGTTTGNFQPVHSQGTQQDGLGTNVPNFAGCVGVYWQLVSTNAGSAVITSVVSPTHVTAQVQSDAGVFYNFPPTVVGPPVTVVGPFSFVGTGVNHTFTGMTGVNTSDPNQFLVTVGGVFQDPSTYTISGTSISFDQAPASGVGISVTQVTGQGSGNTLVKSLPVSTYWALGSFSQVQGYPSTVCFFNDRLCYAGTPMQPQTAWMSQTSVYENYGTSVPQVATDEIDFTINARRENPILDLMPLSDLLLGTASTVWRVSHSAAVGAVTPTDIALIPQNFYGEQNVPSVQTGDTIIYAQWGGRKIRDLIYQFMYDKFLGTELTVYAQHIFPYGTQVLRMAFAPEPYGLLFCVRSDGVLCVCAYLPEQQITAWTRYVTQGTFEDVQVIPENGTYSVYVIVGRTINGSYTRYIERFAPREYATLDDQFFVDSGLTYDGRNANTLNTMTVTGGTTWQAQDTGVLTSSSNQFQSTDPTLGNAVWITDGNGNILTRCLITGYTSATQVAVKFMIPVPASIQGVATANWTFARTQFSGLTNLPNMPVSVFADGGTEVSTTVSSAGVVNVTSPAGVAHIGLSYTCQLQGLNFNQQGQPSIRNMSKTMTRASIVVDESQSFSVGPNFQNMRQAQVREFEPMGTPVYQHTGVLHVQMPAIPSDDLALCLQHTAPVALTVLSWLVDVELGEAG